MIKKFADLLFDATIGLVKQYQQKSLELAKITAATYYIQGIQLLRRHCVKIFLFVFCTLLLVMTLVAVPIALFIIVPWSLTAKAAAVFLLGALYAGVSLFFILDLFSEKRWLKFSGSSKLIDDVASKNGFKP